MSHADADGHATCLFGAGSAEADCEDPKTDSKEDTYRPLSNGPNKQNWIQRIGGAIGKWLGMEYATALQQDRSDAEARAKMTADDYFDQYLFAIILGTA